MPVRFAAIKQFECRNKISRAILKPITNSNPYPES
jgi:hypothetical protein